MNFIQRICIKLLRKSHWYCVNCGDYHRFAGDCICTNNYIFNKKEVS